MVRVIPSTIPPAIDGSDDLMVPSLECDRASGSIYCNESISAVHPYCNPNANSNPMMWSFPWNCYR